MQNMAAMSTIRGTTDMVPEQMQTSNKSYKVNISENISKQKALKS